MEEKKQDPRVQKDMPVRFIPCGDALEKILDSLSEEKDEKRE